MGAGVTNAVGSISYLNRSDAPVPGATFLIADAANDLADIDGDEIVNLLESKLGRDPSTATLIGLPAVTNVRGHLTLSCSFPIGAGVVVENVDFSGDLATWQSGPGFTETMSDTTGPGVRAIVERDAATTPPRYIRLRASQ